MPWFFLAALAAAETPPVSADIQTDTHVAAGPEAMAAVLTDLLRVKSVADPACLGRFELGAPTAGVGATAQVRYDMAAMHRNLTLTVTRGDVSPARAIVDWSHPTNLGFTTRWVVDAVPEGGSHVTVQTGLYAPGWPFTRYFMAAVRPEWTACQAALTAAVAKLASPP